MIKVVKIKFKKTLKLRMIDFGKYVKGRHTDPMDEWASFNYVKYGHTFKNDVKF